LRRPCSKTDADPPKSDGLHLRNIIAVQKSDCPL
jgi:hypothetical protein